MSYQIETIPPFDKAVKRLTRKYRHIKRDLQVLVGTLSANPLAGVAIPGFAHQVWKIRLASSDIRAGKRGGYRVIYAISREARTCYLMYIYSKPEKADVSAKEIEALLVELEEHLFGRGESEKTYQKLREGVE